MGKKRVIVSALVNALLLLSCAFLRAAPMPQAQGTLPASPTQAAGKPHLDVQEEQALQEAIRSAENNPQALIKNLEGFLQRFPASPLRQQVLEVIYSSALRANDPQTAIESGEKLLGLKADDPALLSSLVDLLGRQDDALSRDKALQYANRLVERLEKEGKESTSSAPEQDKGPDSLTVMRARAYMWRGRLYADAGNSDRARADFEKGYAAYPSHQFAERLGDLAAKQNDLNRAIDEYATAFAFPSPGPDPSQREEIRRKLGSCYLALHSSEKGLGDLILARYDELVRTLASRFQDLSQPNANLRDPFAYVLKRTDGSPLPLADYRGKVLVLEFWATWCGPCRAAGSLLEGISQAFRNEPGVVFLAVNVDENRERVPAYLQQEQWTIQVAYAQGLDRLLAVLSLPTLVIFDRKGGVVFRQEGLVAQTFVDTVEKKIRGALGQSVASAAR